jgi:hypothetical protein
MNYSDKFDTNAELQATPMGTAPSAALAREAGIPSTSSQRYVRCRRLRRMVELDGGRTHAVPGVART